MSRLQNTGVKLGHAKMFRALQAIGKFRIPRRPWDAHDCEANTGQKTNIGNLPLSRWKTIEILKIVRFQSLNFTKGISVANKIVRKVDRT